MTTRRQLIVGTGATAAASLTGACWQVGRRKHIAVSLYTTVETFLGILGRSSLREAERLHIDVSVLDANYDLERQKAQMLSVAADRFDGLIISSPDIGSLAPTVDHLLGQNLPLLTLDRRISGTAKPVANVGADNVAGGRMIADYLLARFPGGARFLELTGDMNTSPAIDRRTGFRTRLAEAGPKYGVSGEYTANWKRQEAREMMLGLIGEPPPAGQPDAIFCHNDDMALGVLDAFRAAGTTPPVIIGFDAIPDAVKAVERGELTATVEQSPSRQIRTAMELLIRNIDLGTPIVGTAITPSLITRDTLHKAESVAS